MVKFQCAFPRTQNMFVKVARCYSEYKTANVFSMLQLESNNFDAEINFYSKQMLLKCKYNNYDKMFSEH